MVVKEAHTKKFVSKTSRQSLTFYFFLKLIKKKCETILALPIDQYLCKDRKYILFVIFILFVYRLWSCCCVHISLTGSH